MILTNTLYCTTKRGIFIYVLFLDLKHHQFLFIFLSLSGKPRYLFNIKKIYLNSERIIVKWERGNQSIIIFLLRKVSEFRWAISYCHKAFLWNGSVPIELTRSSWKTLSPSLHPALPHFKPQQTDILKYKSWDCQSFKERICHLKVFLVQF